MAYATGTVNNLADLVTAIFSACTTNGWTLDTDVLSKDGVFVRIRVVGSTVEFLGGTGVDGSDNLTGAGPASVRIRAFTQALTFPMTYEVHINASPDEVYVVVNYAVDFYQWACWGKSSVTGLPGTGVFYSASQHSGSGTAVSLSPAGALSGGANSHSVTPFGPSSITGFNSVQNGFVQHGLDSETWNPSTISIGNELTILYTLGPSLLSTQPNTWNNESVLLPIQSWRYRDPTKVSLIVDLAHARFCRIDYHDPGDIITLGGDSWKLYPFYRKDAVNRNGGGSVQHSGTMGLALRYTGA